MDHDCREGQIAMRLADEGVPVAAIARALQLPSTEVSLLIREQIEDGRLVEMPAPDWRPGSGRKDRGADLGLAPDTMQGVALQITLRLSPAQAAFLLLLLSRDVATIQGLHLAVASTSWRGSDCHVRVVAHQVRRRLRPFGFDFAAVPSVGYRMLPDVKETLRVFVRSKMAQ